VIPPERVVRRFLAGPVVPLRLKPGVPTIAIEGKKYVLSTEGGPNKESDADAKWSYLWALDTEKHVVAMWRASDGSEKVWGPARSEAAILVKLAKQGQVNRVSTTEFNRIDAYMKGVERDTIADLEKINETAKGDQDRAVDRELVTLWKKLEPKLKAELDAVAKGATPIGFRPFRPENVERQAMTYVIGQFFRRNLDPEKMVGAMAAKIPSFDPELASHYQSVTWAIDDLRDRVYEALLPSR